MKLEQLVWRKTSGWAGEASKAMKDAQLALVFGSREALENSGSLDELAKRYPTATLFGCSTAGEIHNTRVYDDSLVVTAVRFERTQLRAVSIDIPDKSADSFACGHQLADKLPREGLCHVFVLSDGVHVNGS